MTLPGTTTPTPSMSTVSLQWDSEETYYGEVPTGYFLDETVKRKRPENGGKTKERGTTFGLRIPQTKVSTQRNVKREQMVRGG